MSRYYATVTTTGGTTTLPAAALVGGTGAFIRIRQIEVFNTTATAGTLILCRLSTAGTPGTAATSRLSNASDTAAAVGALRNTYTSTAPTTVELGRKFPLGAAIGSGIILPFDDYELTIAATASAGIGLIAATGTAPACEVSFSWAE